MKVVINQCWGGFDLTDEEIEELKAQGMSPDTPFYGSAPAFRSDPRLVALVEETCNDVKQGCRQLVVVEIPDDVGMNWHIQDYDGQETIHENHRRWPY